MSEFVGTVEGELRSDLIAWEAWSGGVGDGEAVGAVQGGVDHLELERQRFRRDPFTFARQNLEVFHFVARRQGGAHDYSPNSSAGIYNII